MGDHINEDGEFQSDKYPACPAGKVPLSTKDPTAQFPLWIYAQVRRAVDTGFSADLETALLYKGFDPAAVKASPLEMACVLLAAAGQFRFYETEHGRKRTAEGAEKAESNRKWAELLETVARGSGVDPFRHLASALRTLIPDLGEQIRRALDRLEPHQVVALREFEETLRGEPT
jgi:hypothetical protein